MACPLTEDFEKAFLVQDSGSFYSVNPSLSQEQFLCVQKIPQNSLNLILGAQNFQLYGKLFVQIKAALRTILSEQKFGSQTTVGVSPVLESKIEIFLGFTFQSNCPKFFQHLN